MALLSEFTNLFAPYEAGAKVPTTGITINGVDLANAFAPASQGVANAPATGILVNSTDVATLFAAKGTTTKLSNAYLGNYVDYEYGPETVAATVELVFKTDGTFEGAGRSGRWLAAGLDASLYEILINVTSGDAFITNSASVYQPIGADMSCSQEAIASVAGTVSKITNATITIREIATPANKVEAAVVISATAESWGSSTFPP